MGLCSFSVLLTERNGPGNAEGRPSGGLREVFDEYAQSAGRRMSGPPPVLVQGRMREHAWHPTACPHCVSCVSFAGQRRVPGTAPRTVESVTVNAKTSLSA